jgi:hypothetical protein
MIKLFKSLFQSQAGDLPIATAEPHDKKARVFTLDPSMAPVITLPKSYLRKYVSRWPDGFWEHMTKANSYYGRSLYSKAKDEFKSARFLKNDYTGLNTQLLRTYRKLYKKAVKEKCIGDAYNFLLELSNTMPDLLTDTDRRQYNKIVKELRQEDPGFKGVPMALQGRAESMDPVPFAKILADEQASYCLHIEEDTWVRPKDEKPIYWHDTFLTASGLIKQRRIYNKELNRYGSTHIRIQSGHDLAFSDLELPYSFYRMKASKSGGKLIGCTDDLQLFLLNMEGETISERSICKEAGEDKCYIRCVDLDFDGRHTLFTAATRAFWMDDKFNILTTWIMPPPQGYQIEKGEAKPNDPNVERALSILELRGVPTPEDIKRQFRRLAFKYHPDKNPDDPGANEKTKLIVWAYRVLADEDLESVLAGFGNVEYYYKIMHKSIIELKDIGVSVKLTIRKSGQGDWIYVTYLAEEAEQIYLGCYSGRVYCINKEGIVLKTYVSDDAIGRIEENQGHLYIQTGSGIYIIHDDKVLNHIEIGDGELSCFTIWGFIVKKGFVISLYELEGNLIGSVQLSKEPCEIDPFQNGLIAYTRKERITISFLKK